MCGLKLAVSGNGTQLICKTEVKSEAKYCHEVPTLVDGRSSSRCEDMDIAYGHAFHLSLREATLNVT